MNRVVTFASTGLIAAGLAIMPITAFAQGGSPAASTSGTTVTAPAAGAKVVAPSTDAKLTMPAAKGSAPVSKEMAAGVSKDHAKAADPKVAHPTTAGSSTGSSTGTTGAKTGG